MCASCRWFNLGCLPRKRPLALAIFIPSQVRNRIKSDSNSATIASTLNSNRPTGSVGSYTAQVEPNLPHGELVGDGSGVRQGPDQRVEPGDDQRVAHGPQQDPPTDWLCLNVASCDVGVWLNRATLANPSSLWLTLY